MFKVIMLPLAVLGSAAYASGPCDLAEYRDLVRETERRVVERSELRVPLDSFHPGQRYWCALLTFDITDDGAVNNAKKITYYPSRIIAESARLVLIKYKFDPEPNDGGTQGALIFEIMLDDD